MRNDDGSSRWGTFLLGGLVGGLAGFAASHLRHRPTRARDLVVPGLAAFEQAPCFKEREPTDSVQRERD